jgi:hypothetical protein
MAAIFLGDEWQRHIPRWYNSSGLPIPHRASSYDELHGSHSHRPTVVVHFCYFKALSTGDRVIDPNTPGRPVLLKTPADHFHTKEQAVNCVVSTITYRYTKRTELISEK